MPHSAIIVVTDPVGPDKVKKIALWPAMLIFDFMQFWRCVVLGEKRTGVDPWSPTVRTFLNDPRLRRHAAA